MSTETDRSAGFWTGVRTRFGAWRRSAAPRRRSLPQPVDRNQPATASAIEDLKDAEWQVRESDARYRDLLEAQRDIIFRRDTDGRLTFVNGAYCRAFATSPDATLGRAFAPAVVSGTLPPPLATGPRRHQRFAVEIETAVGARWFDFEEHAAATADDPGRETQCVGRDITEQHAQEVSLEAARDQAEAANRAKSRFLAAMSHEIRTPMNGILGMTALLAESDATAEQRTYIGAVERSARTLLSLIDEILDFSKIEAGRLDLDEAAFSVEDCVQSVVELLYPRAREKGIALAWAIDPDVPRMGLGDEVRLRQIVTNLVGNAVKFTDRGGVLVTVSMAERGDDEAGPPPARDADIPLLITIADSGPGISPDALQTLFAEFERGDEAARRLHGGTGLGLAISRRLARAMGGDIVARSTLGAGSEFSASVHLKPITAPSLDARGRRRLPLTAGHHVLLVMDGGFERTALALTLEGAHVPAAACTLAEAEAVIAASEAHDVPFTMLVVDGRADLDAARAVLQRLRGSTTDAGGHIAAYVVLDHGSRTGLVPFLAAGFDDYLVRPVRPAALVDRLARVPRPATVRAEHAADALARTSAAAAPVAQTVLLVEDNDINALLARRMLEKAGCRVIHATDGAKAVATMEAVVAGRAPPVDLVLMDVHMPVMDGLEACRRLRALAAAGAAMPPVIALTANAFAEDRRACLEAGMNDYLAKPFQRDELEAVLAKWARRA